MNGLIISTILYLIGCGLLFRLMLTGGRMFDDAGDCFGGDERSWPGLLTQPLPKSHTVGPTSL